MKNKQKNTLESGSHLKLKIEIPNEFQITYWIDCGYITGKWCPITVSNLNSVPVVEVWIFETDSNNEFREQG